MAVGTGYSKVASNGLVFAYDAGDVVNSYRGKPTTNILTGVGYTYGFNNGPLFYSQYGTETSFIPGLGGNVVNNYCNFFNNYPGGSGNCCPAVFSFGGFSVSPNTTYTYQIIYRTPDGYANANYMYHYEYGPSGYITEYGLWDGSRTQDLGNGWTHAWGTFTSNANANYFNCYLFHYQYIWTKIQVAGVMLTQGNNIIPPTQFLAPQASRSNTNGLLNISGGSNTINLVNMSYNSNAQFFFDGTDDYMITSNMPAMSNWTAETVINLSNYTTSQKVILDVNLGVRFEINNGRFNSHFGNGSGWIYTNLPSTFTYTPNQFYHVVVTVQSGGSAIMYINGVANTSTSIGSGTTPTLPLYIGRFTGAGGYEFAGQLPVTKIYNRALTAAEVRDNYFHYKTRFGLP